MSVGYSSTAIGSLKLVSIILRRPHLKLTVLKKARGAQIRREILSSI